MPLGTYDLLISYVDKHDENTVEFPHEHPKEYEIYYALSGEVDNYAHSQNCHLKAGEFLFVNSGVEHGTLYKPEQGKEYLTFVFSFRKKNSANKESKDNIVEKFLETIENHSYIIGSDTSSCAKYIDAMLAEAATREWGWEYQLPFLYTNFLLSLIRNFIGPISVATGNSSATLPIQFTKYLHANYQNKDLSIQELADHFYMTPRHISRLFKEYFKASLSKTLTLYRISYAKNYLQNTKYSVDDIADKVGFSSASTLSRLFKEYEGITISEYRYLCKQNKAIINNKNLE